MGTVPDPSGSDKTSPASAEDSDTCDASLTDTNLLKRAASQNNGIATQIPSACPLELNSNVSTKRPDNENICEHEPQESSETMSLCRTKSQLEALPTGEEHSLRKETQAIKYPIEHGSSTDNATESATVTVSPNVTCSTLPSEEKITEESSLPKCQTVIETKSGEKVDLKVETSIISTQISEIDSKMLESDNNGQICLGSQETESQDTQTDMLLNSDLIQEELKIQDVRRALSPDHCEQIDIVQEINSNGDNDMLDFQLVCKFKEMGTMTSHLESWSRQDAEVQAVANVENKSVSTSPSILAAFLKANSPVLKERQEQVCIIYQGNPGNPQMDRANFALHSQLSQNHLAPKVCFQPADAMNPQSIQLHNKSPPDMVRSPFQHPELARNSQVLYRSELDGQGLCLRESYPMTQMQKANASPILMNVKPVYQINIENSSQAKACQRTKDMFSEQPQFRAAHDMGSKARLHHLSGIENIQLHNIRQDSEQTDTLTVPGEGSSDRKPFHFKITNEQGSTQAIITTDIKKPKKEERPTPLHVEVQVNNATGATGGQIEEILEVLVRKDQDEGEHSKRSSSLSLQTRPASELHQGAVQLTPRLRKAREEKKEPILVTLPASEPPKSHGKKASPGSSTEAKAQAKQPAKSVKDVVWDEQGMTWEVYGASMDPEALGIAIQNHLQRQIREHEKMIRAKLKQNRKSISSDTGKKHKRRQHRLFQSIFKNFRRPNCCSHPPPSAVLE